jgi:hypothetical protein
MRSPKWHVSWCVAPKAQRSISSLGQRPRIREIPQRPALKARFTFGRVQNCMNRAFSASSNSWGVAPGSSHTVPLALDTDNAGRLGAMAAPPSKETPANALFMAYH